MSEQAAEQTLRAVISWGRYGESFAYDEDDRRVQPRQSELTATIRRRPHGTRLCESR